MNTPFLVFEMNSNPVRAPGSTSSDKEPGHILPWPSNQTAPPSKHSSRQKWPLRYLSKTTT